MRHRTELLLDQVAQYQRSGQWASAVQLCDQVFRDSWAQRSRDDLVEVVLRLAFLYSAKGEREIAEEQFLLALSISEASSDSLRSGRALNGLGVLYQASGAMDVAEAYFDQARREVVKSGDKLRVGDVETNLGILDNIRGDLNEALEHYMEASANYEAVGHRGRLASVLNNLGMLFTDLGRYDDASGALERGLHISRSIGDIATEGILLTNRTELFLATGDLSSARASCDEAFELASQLGDHTLKTDVLKCYGIIYRDTDKPHLAESHLKQAIELAREIENPLLEAEATRELFLVFRGQERNREALESLNRAHTLFSTLRARHDEAELARRLQELESDFLSLVAKWGESIEAKDRYTSGHCRRVADYACTIARRAGLPESDLVWFRMGAFLHDVGKTEVPEEILNKPGRLTDEERSVMEQHTIAGDTMLAPISFPWDIRPMVRSHHERWDGGGYPDGLVGSDIPFSARILKIADVFDALTTTRSYRQPLSPTEAFKLMEEDSESFDPVLFQIFRELLPSIAGLENFP